MPTIQNRRMSKAQWAAQNPVLAAGEIGLEVGDSFKVNKMRIGNGIQNWNDLPYFSSEEGREDLYAPADLVEVVEEKLSKEEAANSYAPLWQPLTDYATGAAVLLPAPVSAVGKRTAAGTSRAAFDATEQTLCTVSAGATTVDGLTDATTVGKAVAKAADAPAARTAIGAVGSSQIKTIEVSPYAPVLPTEGELWIPSTDWMLKHSHPEKAPVVSLKTRPASWYMPYHSAPVATDNLGAFGGALFQRLNVAMFYWPGLSTVFDAMSMAVTAVGTGVIRWGLYPHDYATGMPGPLAFDLGATDNATVATVQTSVPFTLTRGWWHLMWSWQGVSTTGPTIRARTIEQPMQYGWTAGADLNARGYSLHAGVVSAPSAAPANLGTNPLWANSCLFPSVAFRSVA